MSETWTDEQARWVFRRAGTLALAGAEPVGPFVLPNATFFPDVFDGSEKSIAALFKRMLSHVGLGDVPFELVFVNPEDGSVVSSCSSGGCSAPAPALLAGERVVSAGDGYGVRVATVEAKNPTALTTVLARATGQLFLLEADAMTRVAKVERAPLCDLSAVMLGLGVLVANGSGIEVKGCGGVKVHQATTLSAPEVALGLAIACERETRRAGADPDLIRTVASGLDPVARALFGPASAFVRENRGVVRRLDDAAESIDRGDFSLREPGAGIGQKILRVLGVRREADLDPIEALERDLSLGKAPQQSRLSPEKRAKLAELRALVDETLEGR